MKPIILSVVFTLFIVLTPTIYAHQIDSVGDYRIQIGWMREPAISGESNGIELYISTLDERFAPEEQPFQNGIADLQKDLKIQLVLDGQTTTLPLRADHDVDGKYFTLVEPTRAGFYQVNVLGNIDDTIISKSLHAPRVENKTYLQFPQLPDNEILQDHDNFKDEIRQMQDSLDRLESYQLSYTLYVSIAVIVISMITVIITVKRRQSDPNYSS